MEEMKKSSWVHFVVIVVCHCHLQALNNSCLPHGEREKRKKKKEKRKKKKINNSQLFGVKLMIK
jgi:hypothetical protein